MIDDDEGERGGTEDGRFSALGAAPAASAPDVGAVSGTRAAGGIAGPPGPVPGSVIRGGADHRAGAGAAAEAATFFCVGGRERRSFVPVGE
jgi:hypothetical protein